MKFFKITLLLCLSCMLSLPLMAQDKGAKKGKPNQTDELGRKQGPWKVKNNDGVLIMEVEYKNDKRDGLCRTFYLADTDEPKVMEETNYLDGKKDGDYKRYYFSGETNTEGTFENGKKESKWTKYFEDGTVKWEGNYKKGLRDGDWKFNNRKGDLLYNKSYKDGVDLQAKAEADKAAATKKEADAKKIKAGVPAAKPTK